MIMRGKWRAFAPHYSLRHDCKPAGILLSAASACLYTCCALPLPFSTVHYTGGSVADSCLGWLSGLQVGEVDRARAIYVHAASLSDPRTDSAFWMEWNDFEVQFGNEDTFREMLRIKRSVAASYSQLHFNTAIIDTTAAPATGTASSDYRGKTRNL